MKRTYWRWVAVTAIAPIAWGSTYYVTNAALPDEAPWWGAALRAFPAGIILMLVARKLPRGVWWWRSTVLGILNVAAFFFLIYLSAQLLPSSIASSVMALSPVVMAGFAWMLVGERPTARFGFGALLGIVGVVLLVGLALDRLDGLGLAAAAAAMLMSSLSFILAKRWGKDGTTPLALTAWQLMLGGIVLVVGALVFEGPPPAVDGIGIAAYVYAAVIATAIANWAWFVGIAHLPAATVGIIGLLNPVTGVLLGTIAAHEQLDVVQWVGIALVLVGIVLGQGSGSGARVRVARGRAGRAVREAEARSGDEPTGEIPQPQQP